MKVQKSKTRPNNTTAYAIGDVIAETSETVWTFSDIGYSHGVPLRIERATLHISTDEATALQSNLLLFTEAPTTAADNAACTVTDAQMLKCVGSISFATAVKCITGAFYTATPNLLIEPAGDSKTLYGILLAANTYTPAAQSVITITLEASVPRG